jgi:hypothetical protein
MKVPWAENWCDVVREEEVSLGLVGSPKFQAQEMIGAPDTPGPDWSVNDALAAAGLVAMEKPTTGGGGSVEVSLPL